MQLRQDLNETKDANRQQKQNMQEKISRLVSIECTETNSRQFLELHKCVLFRFNRKLA